MNTSSDSTGSSPAGAGANANLAGYLKDHLAGSVAGLETVDNLIEMATDPELRSFFEGLRGEIEEDQKALMEVLQQAEVEPSEVRQAAAWLVEKVARTKIKFAGAHEGGLGNLQAMEGLLLGITGKRSLWRVLPLAGLRGDFEALAKRAEDQFARLEARRLEAGRVAFTSVDD